MFSVQPPHHSDVRPAIHPRRVRGAASTVACTAVFALLAGCSSSSDNAATTTAQPSAASGASGISGASGSSQAATPGTLPVGVTHGALTVDSRKRTYRLFVPDGISAADKVPLVLALHGGLGTGDQFAESTKFDTVAQREGLIVAYPDGAALVPARVKRAIQTWNAGLCCGPSVTDEVDDVAFLAALIDSLESTLPIDASRVGMMGHSNGAMMTWRFACERPDKIAAAVVVAGALELDPLSSCAPKEGVDLLNIHGDADANVPVAGGVGQGVAGVAFRSQRDSLDAWAAAEDCGTPSATRSDGPLSRQTWTGCRDDTVTENLVVAGAEHPWPGAEGRARTAGIAGTPSQDLDASAEAWTFFAESFKG